MRRSNGTAPGTEGPGSSRPAGRGNFTPRSATRELSSRAAAPPPSPAAPGRTSSRLSPRNWRVVTKLSAILLIPVLVALLFGGLRVYGSYSIWQEADRAERTALMVGAATAYAHALIDERDITTEPLLRGETGAPAIEEAREATDRARQEFWERVTDVTRTDSFDRRLAAVTENEPRLERVRESGFTGEMPGVQTEIEYVGLQRALMALTNELGLGLGAESITSYGRTVYAASLSKAASSLQRAIGTHLLVAPGPGEKELREQLTAFTSYAYLEEVARGEYAGAGSAEDAALMEEAMAAARTAAERSVPGAPGLPQMVQLIGSGTATPEELAERGVTVDAWFRVATTEFEAYRTVEQRLAEEALNGAHDIASAARRDMIVNSAIVLAALLLAFVIAALMARSMSRNMTRLRTAAFDVAQQRLPAVVDQLSRTQPGEIDTRVDPIRIDSSDEIGEVARAFDQVHGEAVRLAADQALLRGNVNAIFTNLSSRNQGLIERQLALISDLENNEADPEQLENLFRLDHLATRMRRNGENLLVLAGEEPGRRWNQPVPLVDVMRAAASEVESYERIELSGFPEAEIHGAVVTDLVHLLAELLENATSFSSPQTKVRVTATRLPDGRIMIEIHDKGIGLSPEDLAEINDRLANPPAVDASVSQRMGLFVVGRLSELHGIRIQLRPSGEQSGTTSLVMLAEAITHGGGGGELLPEEEFTVSRIMRETRETTETPEQAGLRTAAELGFDDSRYDRESAGGTTQPRESSRARAMPEEQQPSPPALPQRGGFEPPDPPYPPPGHPAPGQEEPGYGGHGEPAHAEHTAAGSPGHGGPGYGDGGPYAEPAGYDGSGYDVPPRRESSSWPPFGSLPAHTQSAHGAPADSAHHVGFNAPDPAAAAYRSTTSAGLPLRERQLREESPPRQEPGEVQRERGPRPEARAGGGTTSSGLPKRVPQAHLNESAAEPSQAGGPHVSRTPDDVRGRLSSLHRGVREGRGIGGGHQNDHEGFGPGNTYDQER